MNLERFGKNVAVITVLGGVLAAVIGALLAYAIPDSPQAFVDWVQNKQYNDVISSVASTVSSHTSSTTTRPAGAPEISSNTPNPATIPANAPSSGKLSVGIDAERAIGGPTALTLLSKGAALGGATGLILGLVIGVLFAILYQILEWVRTVIEAFSNLFTKLRNTAFRR
jgi:hypothetical protein